MRQHGLIEVLHVMLLELEVTLTSTGVTGIGSLREFLLTSVSVVMTAESVWFPIMMTDTRV